MNLTTEQLLKIEETLKDFVCLIPRYTECKKDSKLLDLFLSRNRNPLWDITQTKFWETGLCSNEVKKGKCKIVKDHFIQRKMAMKIIMDKLSDNSNMSLNDFIILCKKYSSTINLTKEEHQAVTSLVKNTKSYNYELYSKCGIIVEGLDELITNL